MQDSQTNQSPQLHRFDIFLERTGLSRSSAYREISKGNLKVIRIGRAIRISESEIRRYINEAEAR